METETRAPNPACPSLPEAFKVWLKIAVNSFGGPAGQIAVMHRVLVDEKRWISEKRFLHALNYCMLLPGPEAMQLVTYMGWLLHGYKGGLLAGSLFVLPGFLAILGLSFLYVLTRGVGYMEGLFFGLKAAVLAIVLQAVWRIGSRVLKHPALMVIAAGAFVALFFFAVPFPYVVLTAGIAGYLGSRWYPSVFSGTGGHGAGKNATGEEKGNHETRAMIDELLEVRPPLHTKPERRRDLLVALVFMLLWATPVVGFGLLLGSSSVFFREGVFFSKAAVVTFGGAYSVLSYIAQQAVEFYGWLAPGEMMDGLGMAETTPGPLIQVVQFVGFMGAWRNPGAFPPWMAAVLGSVITTWVTYTPCFLWIFAGAPYVEAVRGNTRLAGALSSITAAVVGVVVNLALWFALHVFFGRVSEETGPLGLRLMVPEWPTVQTAAILLALGAMAALTRFKRGMITTLFACGGIGVLFEAFHSWLP